MGNVFGAMLPAIQMSNSTDDEAFLFIANMHTLTQIKDAELMRQNTYATAAAWLALGFDYQKNVLYRQSDIPECTELAWYLSSFFPYQRLKLATSFKDKADRLEDVNSGLFTYPMLMAADILLYDADVVPVGKDQLQHLEITRDVASRFHHQMGETFVLPQARIDEVTQWVPGTDGEKMSKSRQNFINVFLPEKELKKIINKQIVTDTTALEDPKDPASCSIHALYKLVATADQANDMENKLRSGGYGWGHAKKDLLEAICVYFQDARTEYDKYMADTAQLDEILKLGAEKARGVAQKTLDRVRKTCGY